MPRYYKQGTYNIIILISALLIKEPYTKIDSGY